MTSSMHWLMMLFSLFIAQPAPMSEPDSTSQAPPEETIVEEPISNAVRVLIRTDKSIIPIGSPVFLEFVVQNKTGAPVTLAVPGALKGKEAPEHGMGLPLEHVFSGINFRGLEISSESNPEMGNRVTRKPQFPVPPITLAPFGTVGLRFDVARFYPGLHQAGKYELRWRPYAGAVETNTLMIEVVSFKQAVIETNYGNMTMNLLYDQAPRHVDNFIELARDRFYNGKTFHLVYPTQFILGGCPIGDGTGKRADGRTLAPEFNDTPFDVGTVGMALIQGDANSGSCQFFICLSRQPKWDGQYTAFGRIQGPASLETLRRLGEAKTDENHHPIEPLKIKSITIVDVPFVARETE
ncbi:MAG: peptidylprolyl isomerase [Phycisphaerae bacterium]|nr:peptidylprolyl isomerase [Phycisphaerae bacterium]